MHPSLCQMVLQISLKSSHVYCEDALNGSLPLFGIDDTHLLFLVVLYYLFAYRHRCYVE